MNKTNKTLVILVDGITALCGVLALVMFFYLKLYSGEKALELPAHEAMQKLTPAQLQSQLRVAGDSISFLNGNLQDATNLFLLCALVMLTGCVLRLLVLPWKAPAPASATVATPAPAVAAPASSDKPAKPATGA